MDIVPNKLYFRIGEVSRITDIKPYILRYWESSFGIVRPKKSRTNQRVYTKKDVELILEIKRLIYDEKFTLKGAKKRIKELQREKNRQLKMNFTDRRYLRELRTIKDELLTIKEILK